MTIVHTNNAENFNEWLITEDQFRTEQIRKKNILVTLRDCFHYDFGVFTFLYMIYARGFKVVPTVSWFNDYGMIKFNKVLQVELRKDVIVVHRNGNQTKHYDFNLALADIAPDLTKIDEDDPYQFKANFTTDLMGFIHKFIAKDQLLIRKTLSMHIDASISKTNCFLKLLEYIEIIHATYPMGSASTIESTTPVSDLGYTSAGAGSKQSSHAIYDGLFGFTVKITNSLVSFYDQQGLMPLSSTQLYLEFPRLERYFKMIVDRLEVPEGK